MKTYLLLLPICLVLALAYGKHESTTAYQNGYTAGYSVPVDDTYCPSRGEAIQHVNIQIEKILNDDKSNPVCEYYIDDMGYGYGCLTDVQLDAIIELDTFFNNKY